jgi:hypothetical protein
MRPFSFKRVLLKECAEFETSRKNRNVKLTAWGRSDGKMLQRDRSSVFVRCENATSAGAKIITAKAGPIEKSTLDIPSYPG